LKKIERKGSDMIICLGDISGFSLQYYRYDRQRNASACLELLRHKCEIIIPGNHDLHIAGRIPPLPEGAGYEYWKHEEDLDPGYSEEEKTFLSSLPDYWIIPYQNQGIMLSHYVSPNLSGSIMGFYHSTIEFSSHFQLMLENNCSFSFTGHTHVGGFYTVTSDTIEHYGYRKMYLNAFPVIIGIPPVTRNNLRSGFCIFDTDSLHLQVIKIN
jgi:calcineurin-like phosphoesterase family protein